jgi:hypothetical protein
MYFGVNLQVDKIMASSIGNSYESSERIRWTGLSQGILNHMEKVEAENYEV